MSGGRWFSETLVPSVSLGLEATEVIHEEKTGEQELTLLENPVFGRVMLLDGVIQVTTGDEFIYHEMMAHVPILGHGGVKDVLIIGGGDCGLAQEVLKHPGVESLTQVEIDSSVVEFSRTHFSAINAPVFDDSRFTVEIADGATFMAETERQFDVVLVDSTDPIGPGARLFTEAFYADGRRCLRPGGILVAQNSVPFIQMQEFGNAMRNMAAAFPEVTAYVIAVPTYFGGHMTLGWASDSPDALSVSEETLKARFDTAGLDTRYYTPEVHTAAFALPRYIRDTLEEARKS